MEYRKLGNTDIKVSRLCFGSLTVGPLQANLPIKEGSAVMRSALERGVNFIDTAHIYDNYTYIKEAIKGDFYNTIIASKSYDYTYEGMQRSLYEALQGIGRDYIDIFLLHEQESALTIKGHWDAIEYLLTARQKGLVRAIGISTHNIEGVRAAALIPEFDIVHPLINKTGIGIQGGSVEDMVDAIRFAGSTGKGLYGMKALGGGNLISQKRESLNFALNIRELSAIAVGMQSTNEVEYNTNYFSGKPIPEELETRLDRRNRQLHIEDWCQACGLCIEKCSAGALSIVSGRAVVDQNLCRLCGYCGAACTEFCIKII